MNKDIVHTFIVVKDLIAPAIVGVDFFQQHKLTVDFSYLFTSHYCVRLFATYLASCCQAQATSSLCSSHTRCFGCHHRFNCAIPDYGAKQQFDLPYCKTAEFSTVVSE